MKCKREYMRVYAVTDRMWTGRQTLLEQVEDALRGGVSCIQLREKERSEEDFLQEALEMKPLCRRYGVPFFVNDNVKIAVQCKADGIHVGQDDMAVAEVRAMVGEDMILGVSVQNVEQAVKAVEEGANYLGVGAMFPTETKPDAEYVSMETLRKICEAVEIPVVAIGGITMENVMQLKETGVDGVALVSGIFAAENIEQACKKWKALTKTFQ